MPKGEKKLLTYSEEKYRRKLFRKGLNDSEMARKLGRTREAVRSWRKKRRLKSHNPKTKQEVLRKRIKRWRRGWTDREMATKEGVTIMAILMWRNRRELEPN